MSLKDLLTLICNKLKAVSDKANAATKNITSLTSAMPHIAEGSVGGQYSINISFGGFKICAGRNVITPSAANTLTGKTISFSTTFSAVPYVICSLTGGPKVEVCRMSAASVTKTNFIAYIFASNTTERSFDWLAVGWA